VQRERTTNNTNLVDIDIYNGSLRVIDPLLFEFL
jgi:hypothetical protein